MDIQYLGGYSDLGGFAITDQQKLLWKMSVGMDFKGTRLKKKGHNV